MSLPLPWLTFEQLSEESHCRSIIPFFSDKNFQFTTILIDCPPKLMQRSINLDKNLIQMPFLWWPPDDLRHTC